MKTTQPTHKKLPRGRVMFTSPSHPTDPAFSERCDVWSQPAALIPTHTPAQARAICKAAPFLRMSEGGRVEVLAKSIRAGNEFARSFEWENLDPALKESYRKQAESCLRAMNLGWVSK